jgi:phosphoribosyl-AMP cyclohydrolase / phosphoribosyl-ATP pyrophosphohydrolase
MLDIEKINFAKMHGLIPVCVQDFYSMQVLMQGFMNQEALEKTLMTKKVTFFSRSKNRLWTKGETSGNYLTVVDCSTDCDNDALLIYVIAHGPTCHTGDVSCFKTDAAPPFLQLAKLAAIVKERYQHPQADSYTAKLFREGTKRIAQKVGEEGLEVALAAILDDKSELANEVADLLYHLFVLLQEKNLTFTAICKVLEERMKKNTAKK